MSVVDDSNPVKAKKREEKNVEEAWIIAALGLCVRDGKTNSEHTVLSRFVDVALNIFKYNLLTL